jgi:hypothetical protein
VEFACHFWGRLLLTEANAQPNVSELTTSFASQICQLAASAGNQVNSVKTHPPLPISWFGPSGGLMHPGKFRGNVIKPCFVNFVW